LSPLLHHYYCKEEEKENVADRRREKKIYHFRKLFRILEVCSEKFILLRKRISENIIYVLESLF